MARSSRRGARAVLAVVLAAALAGGSPGSSTAAAAPAAGTGTGRVAPAAPLPQPAGVGTGRVAPAAPLPQPAGKTSLVSVSVSGGFAGGGSEMPAISASGRYVAFASSARDLIAGSTYGASAVYLRDRSTGTTVLLPLPSGVAARIPFADQPSISADGSVVAFTLHLTPDPASPSRVVVWDRASGVTSVVSSPLDAQDASSQPAVSGNGQYVAFASTAPRIVPGVSGQFSSVYRYSRATGQTVLVSVSSMAGGALAGDSTSPSISGDGSIVAFASSGGRALTGSDPGPGTQVFARDMNAGLTSEVSLGPNGEIPQAPSASPSISDDGTLVAFASSAANFGGGQGAGLMQAYRRDLAAGQTVLVSAQDDGSPSPAAAGTPAISRDGRMVAYVIASTASLSKVLAVRSSAVMLRDVTAGQTAIISVNTAGAPSAATNVMPAVGGAGRYVAWASTGTDLVPGDGNQAADVFIRDLPPVPTLQPPVIDFGTRAVGVAPAAAAGVLANGGWGPLSPTPAAIGGKNAADFSILADGCAGTSLYRGDACTVTVGFAPAKPGPRAAQLQVPGNAPGPPPVAALKGNGSASRIVLDLPVAPQGTVVVATGSGFPAGTQVGLTWSTGITPALPIVTADAKGGFRIGVLVFHHDVVGPRNLVATWVGGPEFPSLEVPMLVTVRSVMPPGFDSGRPGDTPLTLLFRG